MSEPLAITHEAKIVKLTLPKAKAAVKRTITEAKGVLTPDAIMRCMETYETLMPSMELSRSNVEIEGLMTASEAGIKTQAEVKTRFERFGIEPTYKPDMLVPPELPEQFMKIAYRELALHSRSTSPTSIQTHQALIAFFAIRQDYIKGMNLDQVVSTREADKMAFALTASDPMGGSYSEPREYIPYR